MIFVPFSKRICGGKRKSRFQKALAKTYVSSMFAFHLNLEIHFHPRSAVFFSAFLGILDTIDSNPQRYGRPQCATHWCATSNKTFLSSRFVRVCHSTRMSLPTLVAPVGASTPYLSPSSMLASLFYLRSFRCVRT